MFLFSKHVQFIKITHGQRVINYAGADKAPIQSASICTQLMCHGLELSLLLGSSVLLLLLLAGQFHPSHDKWVLLLVWRM